jgi:hypothetical protein
LEQRLKVQLDQLGFATLPESRVAVNQIDASSTPVFSSANQFLYRGKYWCVPKSFQFPLEMNRLRLNGWRMWLCGNVVVHNNVAYKIKPFRSFKGINFAEKAVEREFTTKWKPIFKLMEQCPGWEVPVQVDEAFAQSSFIDATEFCSQDLGMWRRAKDAGMLSDYVIGTWSKYVQWSEIEKHGTAQDKANLPQATARNHADKRRQVFTIIVDARPNGRIRLNKVSRASQPCNLEREAVADAFEGAFGVQ